MIDGRYTLERAETGIEVTGERTAAERTRTVMGRETLATRAHLACLHVVT